jgi:hypothetical protein
MNPSNFSTPPRSTRIDRAKNPSTAYSRNSIGTNGSSATPYSRNSIGMNGSSVCNELDNSSRSSRVLSSQVPQLTKRLSMKRSSKRSLALDRKEVFSTTWVDMTTTFKIGSSSSTSQQDEIPESLFLPQF